MFAWEHSVMGWVMRTAVAAVIVGTGFGGTAAVANADDAPTGPDDPACISDPTDAVCMGGPWGLPTSSSSVGCAIDPGQGICQGGPYDPTPPPPPAPPLAGMPGGIGGMDMAHPDIGAMHPDIGAMHPDIGMHPGGMGMGMGGPGHI